MTQRAFNLAVGTIFLLVAILHALRLLFGWHASIGGWIIPMWVSWVGVALAGFLAYSAFSQKRSK